MVISIITVIIWLSTNHNRYQHCFCFHYCYRYRCLIVDVIVIVIVTFTVIVILMVGILVRYTVRCRYRSQLRYHKRTSSKPFLQENYQLEGKYNYFWCAFHVRQSTERHLLSHFNGQKVCRKPPRL